MSGDLTIDWLIEALWTSGGTDLHLTAGSPPLIRRNGELLPIPNVEPLTPALIQVLAGSMLKGEQLDRCIAGKDADFSFGWRGQARIRGNAFRQRNSIALALRLMPQSIPGFDELGLPQVIREMAMLSQGLVLVTGPTGSGKSTTLAAIIDWISANRRLHVLTIEDPIEYVYRHQLGAVNQRAVGEDTESFASALRSALREDPDVLLVGELRDLESIRFAITLAETGHLVFATIHSNDASQTVDRMVDVFPGDEQEQVRTQLALALTAVVHQQLLPRLSGGLVAAHEVMLVNHPIRNLIKEGRSNQLRNQLVMGRKEGMITLEDSLNALLASGDISYEQAVGRARFPKELHRPLR